MAVGDLDLSVLLRNGPHSGRVDSATGDVEAGMDTVVRLALKAEQVSVSIARNPIHVATPQTEGLLVDLGINRTTITVSGIIETVGGDPTNLDSFSTFDSAGRVTNHDAADTNPVLRTKSAFLIGTQDMDSINVIGPSKDHQAGDMAFTLTKKYYIPYKNYLEEFLLTNTTGSDDKASVANLQLEIGDSRFPITNRLANGDHTYQGYNAHGATSADDDGVEAGSQNKKRPGGSGTAQETHYSLGGQTDTSIGNSATGGAIYNVAISQAQFNLAPGMEDRWMYSLQFAAEVASYSEYIRTAAKNS